MPCLALLLRRAEKRPGGPSTSRQAEGVSDSCIETRRSADQPTGTRRIQGFQVVIGRCGLGISGLSDFRRYCSRAVVGCEAGDSGSTARRRIGGERPGNNRFALRMHTVVKGARHETVWTGFAGFDEAGCEVGGITNASGATAGRDRRLRWRSGLRPSRPLIELVFG